MTTRALILVAATGLAACGADPPGGHEVFPAAFAQDAPAPEPPPGSVETPSPAARAAEPPAATADVEGEVVDLDTGKPISSVRMDCLRGETCDGKSPRHTGQDGRFRWSFKTPCEADVRFAYTGWSVITPEPPTEGGAPLADVVRWLVPVGDPQRVEMWRTAVALRTGAPDEARALADAGERLSKLLLERSRAEDPRRRISLAGAWRAVVASPFPVTGRVHVARRILPEMRTADAAVRASCALYAEADPAATLRWEAAVRSADRDSGVLPSPAALQASLEPRLLTEAIRCAALSREDPSRGKLTGRSVKEWALREKVVLDRTPLPFGDEFIADK